MKGHTKGSLQLLVVGIAIIIIGGGAFTYGNNQGWFGQTKTTPTGLSYTITGGAAATPATQAGITQTGGTQVPIGSLNANVQDCYAGSYVTTGANINVYDSATNPSSPTANTVDTLTPGTASTNTRTYTNKEYKILFTDATGTPNYYDRSYFGLDVSGNTAAGKLYASAALAAATSTNVLDFSGSNPDTSSCVVYNATITDIINEATPGNFYSGSTACTNASGATCDFQVETATNGLGIHYDKDNASGSAALLITIGATGGNQALKDTAICFADTDGDMNKTEFTSIIVERISGQSWVFEDDTGATVGSEWVNYWSNDKCIKVLDTDSTPKWIEGGKTGVYKITFTVQENNWLNGTEFTISINDLAVKGSSLTEYGKDLRNGVGSPKTTMTIDAQA